MMSETRRLDVHAPAMVEVCSERGKTASDLKARSSRSKLTQQTPLIMFGTLTRKTLAGCARRGTIGRYYHAASRFSTPHSTQPCVGTPILRTPRPAVRRPEFRTPLLSESCIVPHNTANLHLFLPP